jgi:hypothetical protein
MTFQGEAGPDLLASRISLEEDHAGLMSVNHKVGILSGPDLSTYRIQSSQVASGEEYVRPDTVLKQEKSKVDEEAMKQYEQALEEQEKAREMIREAREKQEQAIRQYREQIRLQREHEFQMQQKAFQEYQEKLNQFYQLDSIKGWTYGKFFEEYFGDHVLPYGMPPGFWNDSLPGVYFYEAPPFDEDEWSKITEDLDDLYFEIPLPDSGLYELYGFEDLPEFELPELPELPEMPEMYILPDSPDVKELYDFPLLYHRDKTESIIRNELIKDGIIEEGEECVVYIGSNMMSVNGEKQSREVLKKYRRLLETSIGDSLDSGYTYFF